MHDFLPQPVLIDFGFIHIYWYGLFMVLAILSALAMALSLAKKYQFSNTLLFDLVFWLIIWGLVGARLYHIGLEYQYYLAQPFNVFKVWQGGLAIHGAIIAGLLTIYYFTKKYKLNFWQLTSIIVPGLALGQAIGRWGNYFNQELFGLPTSLPWGIPIAPANRVVPYMQAEYFHPTFLYESIGNLCLVAILLLIHFKYKTKQLSSNQGTWKYILIIFTYLIGYSILRFSLEFVRIDYTPLVFGLRWPQWVSLLIILISLVYLIYYKVKRK